jgi:hypothetical protein
MDFDDQVELEHLLFFDRKCRIFVVKVKNLIEDYYLTRKIERLYHLHILMNVKNVL